MLCPIQSHTHTRRQAKPSQKALRDGIGKYMSVNNRSSKKRKAQGAQLDASQQAMMLGPSSVAWETAKKSNKKAKSKYGNFSNF
jgi:hypothetical protein